MTDQQITHRITMGAGLTAPERAVPATTAPTTTVTGAHRRLLGAAAVAAPALFAAFVAVDPAPLPREAAADFLGGIAASPAAFVASVALQLAAMTAGVALAAYVAVTFAARAPRLAPLVSVLLTLGYLGGAAFAGAKLVAADLVAGGAPRAGSLEVWSAVHTGALFDVASWPLLMAIPGNLLLGVLLWRCRAVVGAWPGAVVVAGFVLGSGEFPDAVTLVGWLLQVAAVAQVVRRALRA